MSGGGSLNAMADPYNNIAIEHRQSAAVCCADHTIIIHNTMYILFPNRIQLPTNIS